MLRLRFREEIKRWGYLMIFLYLVLLLSSQFYLHDKERTEIEKRDSEKKVIKVEGQDFAYLEWGGVRSDLAPLILIHGSPGFGARDWDEIAPSLAASGRRVIAVDRFGYGDSQRRVRDHSFSAHREAVLTLMDELGIERAHVAGWSYGGGPAILLGEMDRDRILSVSLIASIGIQKGEGSGNYMVEHWKYALLYALANWGSEAVPHFGLLGSRSARYAFSRDFMDMDQRNMVGSLTTMDVPLLIIHGKNDPLVAAWVAQEHHRLRPSSRLVMLDGSHFFPFRVDDPNFRISVEEITEFLAAAETGKASDLNGERNETSREEMRALWDGGFPVRGYKPWFLVMLGGVALGFVVPRTGGFFSGFVGGLLIIDAATGITGVALGAMIRRGESRTRFHRAGLVIFLGLIGVIPGLLLLPKL